VALGQGSPESDRRGEHEGEPGREPDPAAVDEGEEPIQDGGPDGGREECRELEGDEGDRLVEGERSGGGQERHQHRPDAHEGTQVRKSRPIEESGGRPAERDDGERPEPGEEDAEVDQGTEEVERPDERDGEIDLSVVPPEELAVNLDEAGLADGRDRVWRLDDGQPAVGHVRQEVRDRLRVGDEEADAPAQTQEDHGDEEDPEPDAVAEQPADPPVEGPGPIRRAVRRRRGHAAHSDTRTATVRLTTVRSLEKLCTRTVRRPS